MTVRWHTVLSREDARWAFGHGVERARRALALGRAGNHAFQPSDIDRIHTDGMAAAAEFLASRYTGRRWISFGTSPDAGQPDLEGGVEVRWTPKPWGSLILHPGDCDEHLAILAVGDGRALALAGWIWVGEGKHGRFWRTKESGVRSPGFFVPQDALLPLDEFPTLSPA